MRDLVSIVVAVTMLVTVSAANAADHALTFSLLNKSYTNLAGDLEPITQGPLTVRPSSPKNVLVLKDNRLTLRPVTGQAGVQDAHLELDVLGKGWLVADVEAAGVETRFQDELSIPPQTLSFDGQVRLERVDGGYRATAVQAPKHVEVVVKSKLLENLVSWCESMSALPFSGLDCNGLERSISHVALPLPAAGATYFLADSDLTAEERGLLDGFSSPKQPNR
ncbi:MAG: hypothetical protein ABI609_04070 [Acidobacteriota bacterium]